jgi:hypothetical protein
LYTGNNADGGFNTQTITNGIDLAGKGGLTWIKDRSDSNVHCLFDTTRGVLNRLVTNNADAQGSVTQSLTAFNSTGFTVGRDFNGSVNRLGYPYCSWTFREQPKFFDVVTWTGTNGAARTISHNLGSAPGFIIMKRVSDTSDWYSYHRGLNNGVNPENYYISLNSTAGQSTFSLLNGAVPTSTTFNISGFLNTNGEVWVAYLFAHDAGGFGTSGTDNVISCGSYTGNGSATGPVINLGYEPQYVMIKRTNSTGAWNITDVMRGFSVTGNQFLEANTSGAEYSQFNVQPTATGFQLTSTNAEFNASGGTYIYMAIRRPMKVPTIGTNVFNTVSQGGGGTVTTGFPVDLTLSRATADSGNWKSVDRLRGSSATSSVNLQTNTTSSEIVNSTKGFGYDNNVGYIDTLEPAGFNFAYFNFRRASGFFDVVCYTGTGSNTTVAHNLTVVPELMIVKRRNGTASWGVYASPLGATKYLLLNSTAAEDTASTLWNDTAPTSAVFSVGTAGTTNTSGSTFVAYLFSTCPGVSKVGSYTGNGGTQAIACGFTGGARFVIIKRTDSTGDWFVYDTVRGMTTLTNPYLRLNSTSSQSATLGSVTTTTGGFTVDASILAAINTNAASYIFLAIA